MKGDNCYLCMRITPRDVFSAAHKLIQDRSKAHELGAQACEILREAYLQSPTVFCGIKSGCILGGLFYLLGIEAQIFLRTHDIQRKLGVTEISIRTLYRIWLENYPNFFPNCSMEEIPYGRGTIKKLHYKGKYYSGITWLGYYGRNSEDERS